MLYYSIERMARMDTLTQNSKTALLFSLVLLFLSLTLFLPFMHQHPFGIIDKSSCPAYLLELILTSITFLVIFSLLLFFPVPGYIIHLPDETLFYDLLTTHRHKRAPPVI